MRLFYDPISTTSRAVTLFVAEENIDIEMVYTNLFQGEHYGEAFSAMNPNRMVPVLEDEGMVLTECAAILRYIANKTGSRCYPTELKARARVDELMDWFNTNFCRDAAYGLAYPAFLPKFRIADPEQAAQCAQKGRHATENWLEILDKHWIAEGGYLTGPTPTIADYLGATYVCLIDVVDFDLRPYPKVAAWMKKMRSGAHWDETYAAYEGLKAAMLAHWAAAG